MAPTLDELIVADTPAAWRACGFEVEGDVCVVGQTRVRLAPADGGKGLTGWSLRGVRGEELDGLATSRSDRPSPAEQPLHSNGISALDHVVAISSDLEATIASLGERASEVRDAVQPGRRIATLRRSAGLSLPVALITPVVKDPPLADAGLPR
jgi:hypothetical protein